MKHTGQTILANQMEHRKAVLRLASTVILLFGFLLTTAQNLSSEAERLWGKLRIDSLERIIALELSIQESDRVPFFRQYMEERLYQVESSFFNGVYLGTVTETNYWAYRKQLLDLYRKSYPQYVQHQATLPSRSSELPQLRMEAANGPCTNMGFGDGKLTGWTGSYQDRNTNRNNDDTVNIIPGTVYPRMAQHCVMSPTMRDPYIRNLPVVLPGKTHSVRLGNTVQGGHIAKMRQTFLVDSSNMVFTYHYAVVLEDPEGAAGHSHLRSPHFQVSMYTEDGATNKCAGYSVIVKGNLPDYTHVCVPLRSLQSEDNYGCPAGATGFDGSPQRTMNANNPRLDGTCPRDNMDLYYKNWTTVAIVLDDYLGQNVTVEFTAADCVPGGHLGYAYVTAECAPLRLSDYLPICSGKQTRTLTAPLGMRTYQWSGPGIVGPSNTQTITVNRSGKYQVITLSKADFPCPDTQTVEVKERCLPMEITKTLCETVAGSGILKDIDLTQFQSEILTLTGGTGISGWYKAFPTSASNKLLDPSKAEAKEGTTFIAVASRTPFPSDTILVAFHVLSKPKIQFPTPQPVCVSSPPFSLRAIPAGGTFLGPHTSPQGLFTPLAVDTFTVQYKVTNAAGCTDSLPAKVIVLQKITVSATGNQTVCFQNNPLDLPIEMNTSSDSVRWTTEYGTVLAPDAKKTHVNIEGQPPMDRTIQLIASAYSPSCPTARDTIVLTLHQLPLVLLPKDTSLCPATPTATLRIAGNALYYDSLRYEGTGIAWNNPRHMTPMATFTQQDPAQVERYPLVLHAYKSHCPVVSDTMQVTLQPLPAVQAPADTSLCGAKFPQRINLRAQSQRYDSIVWQTGQGKVVSQGKQLQTTLELPNKQTTTLVVSAFRKGCIPAHDTMSLTYEPLPVLSAIAIPTCQQDRRVVLNGNVARAGRKGSGRWSYLGNGRLAETADSLSDNAYLPAPEEIAAGKVVLGLTSEGESRCPQVDTLLEVTLPVPSKVVLRDTTVCENTEVELVANTLPQADYYWNGASLPTRQPTMRLRAGKQALTLKLKVKDAQGCEDSTSATVKVIPKPVFTISGTPMCPGHTSHLHVDLTQPTGADQDRLHYVWKAGTIPMLAPSWKTLDIQQGGSYTLELGIGQCTTQQTYLAKVLPVPVLDLPTTYKHCFETDPPLRLQAPAFRRYEWRSEGRRLDTVQTIHVAPEQDTYYQLKVANQYNCQDSIQVLVRKVCPPRLFVPNVVTPFSNDVNARLHIFGAHYTNFEITIFSRWGEVIFNTKDDKHAWNGEYRNENMPIGTYPWIVTYEGDSEEYKGPYKLQGDVTVVR